MPYTISGVVACCGGFPVENATVVIDGLFALSNENGNFELKGITPGNHTIKVLHRSYQTLEVPVVVDRNMENVILYTQYQGSRKRKNMSSILEVKKSIEHALIGDGNSISGIGLNGNKIAIYRASGNAPRSKIRMSGYDTDYRPVGKFVSYAYLDDMLVKDEIAPESPVYPDKVRPICGGIGVSNSQVGGIGTIASVVTGSDGKAYILSNNHVLGGNSAPLGSRITQPGGLDGGNEKTDTIATLSKFIPYDTAGYNIVDAAIAEIEPGTEFYTSAVVDDDNVVSMITDVRSADVGDRVKKHGRTSGKTTGEVIDTDFTTTMPYPGDKTLVFKDQLLINLDSYSGDSGSLIFDEDGYAVGLLIGGSITEDGERYAVANKIKNVAAMLGIGF